MNKKFVIPIFVIVLIIGLSLLSLIGFSQLSTIDSQGNYVNNGDYIGVFSYGRLACEESDNKVTAPGVSEFETFGSRVISCQQQGSLVQECDVTLKLPSEDEVSGLVSFLGVTKCTEGSGCELEAGDDFTNVYYAKGTLQFLSSNEQKLGYNAEIDYSLDKNEYLYV